MYEENKRFIYLLTSLDGKILYCNVAKICTSRGSAQGSVKKQLGSGLKYFDGSGFIGFGSGKLA